MPDPIPDQNAFPIDPVRLERCLELRTFHLDSGRYQIAGGAQTHWVDLISADVPRCDCGDHLWRERACKHILAALLREGDERVLAALRDLIASARSRPLAA
jgi:hypothetical protein